MTLETNLQYTLICETCDNRLQWDGLKPLPEGWLLIQEDLGTTQDAVCSPYCLLKYAQDKTRSSGEPAEIPWVGEEWRQAQIDEAQEEEEVGSTITDTKATEVGD
jgi:hypothetical protein